MDEALEQTDNLEPIEVYEDGSKVSAEPIVNGKTVKLEVAGGIK